MSEKLTAAVFTIAAVILATGCGNTADDPAGIRVAVSVLPQKHFVETIAGETAEVLLLVPPGASPATYEPTPENMRTMAEVDVWFTIGVPFEEAWLPRFRSASDDIVIVNTIEDLTRLPIDRYGIGDHDTTAEEQDGMHDHDGSHHHGTHDPHVWLSPEMVKVQAEAMAEGLSEVYPHDSLVFDENLHRFLSRVEILQDSIHSLLDDLDQRNFIVFHPAWGYFADEFGLVQIPIEIGGSDPSPAEMATLVDTARERNIGVIFVSPQFSTATAEAIADEIGADVLFLDPLAEHWSDNLLEAAASIAHASGDR